MTLYITWNRNISSNQVNKIMLLLVISKSVNNRTLTFAAGRHSLMLWVQIVVFVCNQHVVMLSCILVRRWIWWVWHLRVFWWCTWICSVACTTLSTAAFARSRCWRSCLQIFEFLVNFQRVTGFQFSNTASFLSNMSHHYWLSYQQNPATKKKLSRSRRLMKSRNMKQ